MAVDVLDQLTHFIHLVLGFGAAGAAVVALVVRKGGRWHRWSGWAFTGGMVVAAVTAWGFMIERPLPLAMVSATLTLYGLGMALFALNPHWRGARGWEWALFALLLLVLLGMLATAMNLYRAGSGLFPAPLAMFAVISVFAVLDWRFLRLDRPTWTDRVRRHSLRMALVLAQAIMAPTIIVAPDIGVPVPVIVFGSLLLTVAIHFALAPQARRAAGRLAEAA